MNIYIQYKLIIFNKFIDINNVIQIKIIRSSPLEWPTITYNMPITTNKCNLNVEFTVQNMAFITHRCKSNVLVKYNQIKFLLYVVSSPKLFGMNYILIGYRI